MRRLATVVAVLGTWGAIARADGLKRCKSDAGCCGDGVLQAGELCDSGGVDTPECNSDCTIPFCGDHHVNASRGEGCDEGAVDTATCDADCTFPACGDGHVNPYSGEQCDPLTPLAGCVGCRIACAVPQ